MSPSGVSQGLTLLDCQALIARRNEAGLSRRALAHRIGVSQTTIRLLELGRNHDVITLGLINRLCDALGVQLASLLSRSQETLPPTSDERQLEAALAEWPGSIVHRSDVERAFGWSRKRFEEALKSLDHRLECSGQKVVRIGWGKYALRARSDSLRPKDREALRRTVETDRRGLSVRGARLLSEILAGRVAENGVNNSKAKRLLLGGLQSQGLIESVDGVYRPTPDVAFSLAD